MMDDYYSKIKALIKTGAVLETLDSGNQQRTFSRWLGKARQKVESFVPYGFFGSYPAGTKQLLLAKRGNESNIVGLADGSQSRIKKDTKPGEVGFGNPLTQANLYFKENGDLVIEIPKENLIINAVTNIEMTAAEIHLNGDSKRLVTFADLDSGLQTFITSLNSHVHPTAATGPPSPPTTPMTLDIDSSETTTVKTGG